MGKSSTKKLVKTNINQFHEIIFWPNFTFCNFKNDQKSIFELGKSLKLPKMHFHKQFFWIYLISRVFCLDFFFIFWPAVSGIGCNSQYSARTCSTFLRHFFLPITQETYDEDKCTSCDEYVSTLLDHRGFCQLLWRVNEIQLDADYKWAGN